MKITSLSLTRKEAEGICIGDDITVYVDKIGQNKVQLTIHAPEDVVIPRDELLDDSSDTEQPD